MRPPALIVSPGWTSSFSTFALPWSSGALTLISSFMASRIAMTVWALTSWPSPTMIFHTLASTGASMDEIAGSVIWMSALDFVQ